MLNGIGGILLEFAEQADSLLRTVVCNIVIGLNAPFKRGQYTSDSKLQENREELAMSIAYKDTRRRERKGGVSGPILAAIVVVGGLLMLGPQTTSKIEGTLLSFVSLPTR